MYKTLLVIALFSLITEAKVYLVGPGRTYTQIETITDLLQPGDTVFVDGDKTYTGGVTFKNAGLASKKIVIKGVRVNGKRPLISGGVNTVAFVSDWPYTSGADHYVFEGFDVTGGSSRGIYHQANDLTIRDVVVRNCPMQGILGADQGSGSCLIEYCEIYNCGSGDRNHQIYMSTDQVNHPESTFRLQHCYIHDAAGGNNVKSRAERNEIYYNWIEGAYYHELELIGPDPDGVADNWTPELKREDSDVVGNVLRKKATAANNDPNFAITRIGGDGTGESGGRYRFVNNTIICGSGAVFRIFDALESVEMHNNLFYRSGGPAANITRTVEATWTTGAAVIAGSNNWAPTGSTNVPQQWTGTMYGNLPGFTNFESTDFSLTSASPLIKAGTRTPAGAPKFEFPSPQLLPEYEPPLHMQTTIQKTRLQTSSITIGAFESDLSKVVLSSQQTVSSLPYEIIVTKGQLVINESSSNPGLLSIDIFSLRGELIWHKNASSPASVIWHYRDTNGKVIQPGQYIVRINNRTSSYAINLVAQI